MTHRPRKRFAQHWLRSETVLNQIVAAAQLQPRDRVLEIGPGKGVLTQQLLPLVECVVAVEIDRDLCSLLIHRLGHAQNFQLLQADILAVDLRYPLEVLCQTHAPEEGDTNKYAGKSAQKNVNHVNTKANKVVANIPYNITGPILEKLLGSIAQPNPCPFERIVLLVQKEIAERLQARPGSKAYGALSVKVQYLADCELICAVPPQAFYPPPKVQSAVICLHPRSLSQPALDPNLLETLVKMGFASRRKMLHNNLKSILPPSQLTPILEALNLNPQARAEDLSLSDWIRLSNEVSQV